MNTANALASMSAGISPARIAERIVRSIAARKQRSASTNVAWISGTRPIDSPSSS